MKWKPGDKWHQTSEDGRWIINKSGGPNPVYMLVKRNPSVIVKVGTLAECKEAAK